MEIRHTPRRALRLAAQLSALAVLLTTTSAMAVGTLAPAPQRADMVHDDTRGIIYITQGDQVLRYHIGSGTYLSPIALGGQLRGLDISADNATLAVADDATGISTGWVHLVSLNDLTSRTVPFDKELYESGTFSVSFGADNALYATTNYWGSGWTPMRRLDTATDTWTQLASVRQATMLSSSGDGDTIAFAETNSSDGPWGLVDVPTGQIVRRNGYTNGTSWYNYEIATDRLGSQFAIPTYGGTFIYNDAYQKVATLGQYAGAQPIGVAYHPVDRTAYFPWAQSGQVRVYDMNNFTQTGSYDFQDTFSTTGNGAFVQGRTKLSKDGSLLMVSVTGGVRFLETYAPLTAAPASANALAGVTTSLALPASIGNGGSLQYSIVRAPVHGNVVLSAGTAAYTAQPGYAGSDSFRYRVQYGRASREAEVQLTVTVPNSPPVAVNDNASARRTSILIPVLNNDSDPDGDKLTITNVTRPRVGSTAIEAGQIRFTPPRSWSGSVTFNYTIADGRGGTALATVTVVRF
jgi:Bacterial Ig domain